MSTTWMDNLSHLSTWWYTVFELVICYGLYSGAKNLIYHGKPTKIWYDKNDPSIRKPFVVPTVSMQMVTYGTLLIPLIPVAIAYIFDSHLVDTRIVIRFLFGWGLNAFVCYIIKGLVGRLRPNFMTMNSDEIEIGRKVYKSILARDSTYENLFILESRKSFYSGHASAGSYAGTFTVLFLHSLVPRANLVLSLIKIFSFILGLYPGITQGICFFHHWTDVIAGHLAGMFFASFAFYFVQ